GTASSSSSSPTRPGWQARFRRAPERASRREARGGSAPRRGDAAPRPCRRCPRRAGMPALVLVGRGDGLADDDLRGDRGGADRADERLQARVAEELLEGGRALPLVHHQDEAVADTEAVMNTAGGLRRLRDLRELFGALRDGLAEYGGVSRELGDDQHA